jgi:hypothetical protein
MNFIVFEDLFESSHILIADLQNQSNIKIIFRDRAFGSRIFSKICRFHMSQSLNRKFSIPFQKVWYSHLVKNSFPSNEPLCFLFNTGWFSPKLIFWLRKKYPNAKQVLFLQDTVAHYEQVIPRLRGEELLSFYDLVLSYNPEDAEKYNFYHVPVYISRLDQSMLYQYVKSDISFIGIAKDRLPLIHCIFEKLQVNGIKPDFYITNVEKSNQKFPKEITYAKKSLSYFDYLGHEAASNCILEIIKGDTKGNTYRCWEAVFYNKKLITNWEGIKTFPFYNPKFMQFFSTVEEINIKFISDDIKVDYHYNDENSPRIFIKLIQRLLI